MCLMEKTIIFNQQNKQNNTLTSQITRVTKKEY